MGWLGFARIIGYGVLGDTHGDETKDIHFALYSAAVPLTFEWAVLGLR